MGLNDEQLAHYREHGWVAPVDVMSEAEAGELLSALERAEADHPGDLHREHRNNAHLAFPFLADVVTDPRIVDCAEAIVGPDIAHALVATAVGLFAAIPAVMAFNYFNSGIRVLNTEMDNFSADFLNIVKRHLR